jgi:alpha-D-xyloside xylohydrolase
MFTLDLSAHAAVIRQPIVFRSPDRLLRIGFVTPSIARITFTGHDIFRDRPSRIVIGKPEEVSFELRETPLQYTLRTAALTITLDRPTGRLVYYSVDGQAIMQEPERGGKWLTPRSVTRNIVDRNAGVAESQSIDGARAAPATYTTIFDRHAFEAKLEFDFAEDEALFGLGSHEEGFANLRGRSRDLYQQNMKAVVPHLVSTRGYGVLLDCGSLMTFHDDALGSYWWADCIDELDYYFLYGETCDGVIRYYRRLTGRTPLPPRWAFGYVQSKERYVTAQELIEVVREYRRRAIPLDVIVLDWKSWPNGAGWGQKSLDPARFPNPEHLTAELHALGARLMVSIWPIMTGECPDQRELRDRGFMLGNQSTYDAFQAQARDLYWQQAERGLFSKGVDAWWCDCTEPFEADWSGAVKPEPHQRLALNTEASKRYLDAADINAYSLLHSQGMYEGQRRATSQKRVLNLTRSSYAGQHRYGTFTWNGDICGTWESLRRSIAEGLNFCATGEPYWTVDIGGFFLRGDTSLWFWRGDYDAGARGLTAMEALEPDPADKGCTDLGFHELYTRWLQYAAFLPMFRSHGTDAPREIWRFGEPGNPFYDAIASAIRLRYRLLPYIYSVAASVTFHDASMIRALALCFPQDRATHVVADQFLFGPSIMVCPITRPMYYDRNSQPIEDADHSRLVYLPQGRDWYDFWSGKCLAGGQTLRVAAPLDRIPLYLSSGSILVTSDVVQHTGERADAPYEIHVYTGADASFILYEDDGDGYAYESGAFATVLLSWRDSMHHFTLAAREGDFPSLVRERDFRIIVHTPQGHRTRNLRYTGAQQTLSIAGDRSNP